MREEKKSPFGHFVLYSSCKLSMHEKREGRIPLDSRFTHLNSPGPTGFSSGYQEETKGSERRCEHPWSIWLLRPHHPHFYHSRHHHQSHSPSCSFRTCQHLARFRLGLGQSANSSHTRQMPSLQTYHRPSSHHFVKEAFVANIFSPQDQRQQDRGISISSNFYGSQGPRITPGT